MATFDLVKNTTLLFVCDKADLSLRPVVCRQVLEAERQAGDAITIDGQEVIQVTLVAQIVSITKQAVCTWLKLDDGTGLVQARQWMDKSEMMDTSNEDRGYSDGDWVRVLGYIKPFQGKRSFSIHSIRVITDYHEVYFALLEALQVHMFYTRGPVHSASSNDMEGVTSTSTANPYAPGGHDSGQTDPFAHLPAMQRKIVTFIINSAAGDEGVHVTALTKGLGTNIKAEDVSDALETLTESGHIYNTIDEYHYSVST
ncbi:replication factor A protein 2 [Tulasnella sp. 403]|nr:replication factor A protein 2 [Tulasnella sp. 403]